ncbi:YqaA family protein [Candidatus Spongiihabitans sp.]|uniref:YqaA family protein n=1 Tax=Candidatus Spongiihabitans sp. TaxID=3101308 RepID=UPI003C7B315C
MKIFGPLYCKVMQWCNHPQAEKILGGVSFIESSFFPIPTSLMLAPMVLATRDRAWWLASLATITSVLGGIFGYLIGYFLFDQLGQPILEIYGLQEKFITMKDWFDQYGVWLVLLAGLTPLPYKLFTITSGVLGLALLPFILASIAGRASQFFLVAGVLWWGGEKIQPVLNQWAEWIGWGVLALALAAYLLLR